MTVSPFTFSSVILNTSSSPVTFCTLPALANTQLLAARVRFANTDSAAHAVTAFAIPSGGAATVTNTWVPTTSVAANNYLDVDMPVLGASGTYSAYADTAGKVSVTQLSGTTFTP